MEVFKCLFFGLNTAMNVTKLLSIENEWVNRTEILESAILEYFANRFTSRVVGSNIIFIVS